MAEANAGLKKLKLFPHHGPCKSWDTFKMLEIISRDNRNSMILDVGCNGSPILPMLKRLGFQNLYGCDLVLKPRYDRTFMKIVCSFYKREYKPVLEMYDNPSYRVSIQDLENTNYPNEMFDYITSLSVIEHGVNLDNYFREMSRILKKKGYLLSSTDYWPEKIVNKKKVLSKGPPDNVFSREEIENAVNLADSYGLKLIEPIDFTHGEKVVHWKDTGLDYTYIFFAMRNY